MQIEDLRNRFTFAINEDLNTAEAISVLWQTVKSNIPSGDKLDLIYLYDDILGLKLDQIEAGELQIPDNIIKLVQAREVARQQKNFKESDRLRTEIEKNGF